VAGAPLLVPALAFVGAIAAASLGGGWRAGAAAAATLALAARRSRLPAAFALAALAWCAWRGTPPTILHESRTVRVAGTIVGDVRQGDATNAFPLALDGSGMVVRMALAEAVAPGDRLVVRGRLEPFDEARNPGEPSRRAIALGEGLAGELHAARLIARTPPAPFDARAWAARARAALSARLRARVREPEATVLAGALWGERGTLPRALRDDFQATGTVHVLVTAGLHLGVVAAVIALLLRLASVPRIAASLAAIPCVIAYAWLSGAHLPSQRAAVMVSVALLARACGARVVSWNALALAAVAVALLWPASVTTVSFALSFSCVASIVLFARPLEHALARAALPARMREALALTIATQIGVWPLSAATFGLIAPYAVLANAVVVPATGLGMVAGSAALAFANLPPAGDLAALIAAWDVAVILRVVEFVAALPGARLSVAPPPAAAIVAYDAAAIIAGMLLRRTPRGAAALLIAASLAVLITTLRPPDGRLTITMLDVGQGDGIVIRTPRGHTILIDSGGRLERGGGDGGESPAELVGERIVLAYLKRAGVRSVDLLVTTHPHGDHVGGCFPIVQAMRVDALGDSGQAYGGRAFRDCVTAARVRHVPVILVRRGMHYVSDDGVTLDALGPEEPLLADGANDVNENSVVLRLTYRCTACARPFRMLFMGDAGAQSEARMLATGADLEADVLKVGHHGSAYSSTPAFIAAIQPRYALISVGRHNLFGHPAQTTLTTLQHLGAAVYRTDRCGAISVEAGPAITITPILSCR
jgi:competence protein ComEC